LSLRTLDERRQAIEALLGHIKYLPGPERLRAVQSVAEAAEVPLPGNLMLRSEQLLLLRDAGMQIGAHTVSHPILERCTDQRARWEMGHSKRTLETLLHQPVTLFAYPNGKPGTDYSARHVAMAGEAGFAAAVSTASGAAAPGDDMLQLPRYTPWDRSDLRSGLRMLKNLRERAVVP
jgi:peptidoglycan/xylan/chitin deacetylase (PgdA/CDA1 family)